MATNRKVVLPPPPMLVTRGLSGLSYLLWQEVDQIASGKPPDMNRINALGKIAQTNSLLLRDAMAMERHRATVASSDGIVIEHEPDDVAPAEKAKD